MALITCPECRKEISDKATMCPNCGYPLVEDSQPQPTPQQIDVTAGTIIQKNPKSRKKALIGGIIAIISIIVIVVAIFVVHQHNVASARAEYIENLSLIRMEMLSGGAIAEEMCNLTKSVWYNAIYEKRDSTTDAYTMTGGKFNEDFNDSLRALYANPHAITVIDELRENRETVAALMNELQNPPDGLESCYSTVESLYDVYFGLTGLAISPTGSLKTYSENFNTYDADFMRFYEKLGMQIPEA